MRKQIGIHRHARCSLCDDQIKQIQQMSKQIIQLKYRLSRSERNGANVLARYDNLRENLVNVIAERDRVSTQLALLVGVANVTGKLSADFYGVSIPSLLRKSGQGST